MPTPDAHANFAYSTVVTPPSPTTSGLTLTVTSGEGTRFPTAPFNAVVCPAGALPLPTNAEIVRVTARATDTLTITRAQEGTTARAITAGDQIFAAITAKSLTDAEADVPIGSMMDYAGLGDPTDTAWLLCDGRAVSRTTYASLFSVIVPSRGTVTMTIAAPGVLTTGVAHGLQVGDTVFLTTTGALPTGLTANTLYYVASIPSTTTLTLSATLGGSAITTTGSQSGVHTLYSAAYGNGDGTTTFNLPDLRGRVTVGQKNMGTTAGAASGRIDGQLSVVRGGTGGAESVALSSAQLPSHTHGLSVSSFLQGTTGTNFSNDSGSGNPQTISATTAASGTGATHANMQPFLITNKIIKVL